MFYTIYTVYTYIYDSLYHRGLYRRIDLYATVAAKQRICLHWHLASRLEIKLEIPRMGEKESGWQGLCDFEPCLRTNFGTSVKALPNVSTKMGGKKTGLRTNGIASLLVNAQFKNRKSIWDPCAR
ncbi:hypothetical protein AVEN_64549-1 [Araneus ventricosus]|uniref:Uncharacterized protein n=1 Tax=Araneus ventricosus TaxID=182803 RepID=A0A4Y2WW76_ARAVE|nr:hypothetical protein AVEN_59110-1 [Araneus ventricosus]GBO41096.1 hypothetical protein AVEN_64549-1 [Araneus ventricosus]